MRSAASGLAMLASSGAALLVLLLFAPSLQAPFLVPKFAALELTASLGLVAFAIQRMRTGRPRWSRPVAVGLLLVVATSTVAWIAAARGPLGAPYALAAVAHGGSLFGLASATSVLDDAPEARQRVLEAITAAAAIVAAIGLVQHFQLAELAIPVISTPGSTFGNRNGAAEVMALALPLGLGAAAGVRQPGARVATLGAVGIELAYLAVTRTRGAWIGAACGVSAAIWLVRPRWSRTGLALALGALVAAGVAAYARAPYNPRDIGDRKRYSGVVEVLEEGLDPRASALRTRFGLWRRTMAMVRDHPLLGVGPGNWPVLFPRYAEPGATLDGVLSPTLAPRQAHDDWLERAAEAGVPGLVALGTLAAGVAAAVRRRLREGDPEDRAPTAAAAGALVSLAAVSVASFPLEMPGPLALGGLALGMVAADRGGDLVPVRPRALAFVPVAAALLLMAGAAVRAERNVRSSGWLATAERAMHRDSGSIGAAEALGALTYCLEATPGQYRAELRSAQMLLREHRAPESVRAAERALAVEPYAPNAWAALAAAHLDGGDPASARRDSGMALELLNDYPFALQIRAVAAEQLGDGQAAREDRRRLRALADGKDDDTSRTARALLHAAE